MSRSGAARSGVSARKCGKAPHSAVCKGNYFESGSQELFKG